MEFKIKGKKITNEEKDCLSKQGLKWCSSCKKSIPFDNFNLDSKILDGHCAICRECSKNKRKNNLEYYKQKDAERYQNKRGELIEKAAKYRVTHQEQIKGLRDKYYQENKETILAKNNEYRENNLDKIKDRQKEYHLEHKESRNSISKEYNKNNRKKLSEYVRYRYNNDNDYKLRRICREMVKRMFYAINTKKNLTTNEILGYSPLELKQHIEKQFKPGMAWNNYGEWHIDHIIPISTAKNLEEGIELSRLENLQPLWAEENLTKGNKTNWEKIN